MNPQESQQVIARDEKYVPSTKRVKISPTNVRLETTMHQQEESFQVIIDVIKNSTCFKQRSESYDIKESMSIHCGFVKGDTPGCKTGFDIDDSDFFEMDQCRGIIVASAIYGVYDLIQQPKNISESSKQKVCFFIFVDEETASFLRNSSDLDDSRRIGL
nr:hypothetical protein CTI12_AA309750 [Tanacetum cinerariifolium]